MSQELVEDYEALDRFATKLREIEVKSQEEFERQITYVCSGALAVSIILIEKFLGDVKGMEYKWVLFVGWSALCAALLVNFFSHWRVGYMNKKTIKEISARIYDSDRFQYRESWNDIINNSTILLMCIGIVFLVIFIIINYTL